MGTQDDMRVERETLHTLAPASRSLSTHVIFPCIAANISGVYSIHNSTMEGVSKGAILNPNPYAEWGY